MWECVSGLFGFCLVWDPTPVSLMLTQGGPTDLGGDVCLGFVCVRACVCECASVRVLVLKGVRETGENN